LRTLSEILDAAKDDQVTTHEECLYALLAMSALHHFDHMDVRRQGDPEAATHRAAFVMKAKAEESFRRFKIALDSDPKRYVGWNNDPKNPAYRQRRAGALKLLDKLTADKEDGR
jgi:hypothetical protein